MRLLRLLIRLLLAGHGRPLAAATLAGLVLLVFLPEPSPLATLRNTLFDTYQTCLPRERLSAPATIVGIDDASLKHLGQWPWPRTRLAKLVEKIAAYRPAAIGLDLIMPEQDRSSPARMADALPQVGPALRKRLLLLPDNDQLLAATLAAVPVVIGAAGQDYPTEQTANSLRTAPVLMKDPDISKGLRNFPVVLKSIPELEAAASGQALLNVDLEKGIVRRIPIVATVAGMIVPTLSLEMLRVATGAPSISIESGPWGALRVGFGDVLIPTGTNGKAWVHFSPFLSERYISAADILSGRLNPEMLEQKLVLIGVTGLGLLDYQTTPRGERVPGIEVHAQFLENIFDKRFLIRPAWFPLLESILLLASGIGLIIIVPFWPPRISITVFILLIGVLIATGFLLYQNAGLLFDSASVSLSLAAVFTLLFSSTFIEADRERRRIHKVLQLEREASARIAGELEAARRIQMGSLPQAAKAFPGETRFEMAALLEPARVVGGDLYDFYMLDRNRLFFLVGDVSGKGLPACLFMVMTKALLKSIALQRVQGIGSILASVNEELARENPESLFVTAFAAILDVESGALEYCIAGHDPPWFIGKDGTIYRFSGDSNLPLCVQEGFSYIPEMLQMAPGDTICVLTDGITEAMNGDRRLYGGMRVTGLLECEGRGLTASELVARVRNDVHTFVGDAEPSDDLAILSVRWHGSAAG